MENKTILDNHAKFLLKTRELQYANSISCANRIRRDLRELLELERGIKRSESQELACKYMVDILEGIK